jgi:putative endonuclease
MKRLFRYWNQLRFRAGMMPLRVRSVHHLIPGWRGKEVLSEKNCLPVQFVFYQWLVNLIAKLKSRVDGKVEPEHLRRGKLGELAAKKLLQKQGMKFLFANFRSDRGEIDLIFRDGDQKGIARMFFAKGTDCLVFVEVKTRSSEDWVRPAASIDARKRRALTRCAFDYLRLLKNPPIKIRFDVVEVLLADGTVGEVRHLPNTFTLSAPYRYG